MPSPQPPSVLSGSEGFRFRLIGTTRWRAGDHPVPSVSIETYGDFEKVLGCQQIKCWAAVGWYASGSV